MQLYRTVIKGIVIINNISVRGKKTRDKNGHTPDGTVCEGLL